MISRPRTRLAAAAVCLLLSGCATGALSSPSPASPSPAATPPSTPPATSATASPTAPAGCGQEEITPTRITVPSLGIDEPVLALGKTANGNVDAPPHDALMTAGWYKLGPRPGAQLGHVVMTAHTTIRQGRQALGNELNARLKEGTQIRLSDAAGKTVCYRYASRTKIWVATYQPGSTVWINNNGPQRIALLTCDDYNAKTGEWDSRWVLYADQVTG